MPQQLEWPNGKSFAFTIFDDTDNQTVDNAKPVYDFLHNLGLRTTKSVWPVRGPKIPLISGGTCEEPEYLAWALELQRKGFEIGLHNVTYHTSLREETRCGIEKFEQLFGDNPHSYANHSGNEESIYWGSARLTTGMYRLIYNALLRFKTHGLFQGHIESSPLFWGDICKERVKYVRNFVFGDINTLNACPYMPYQDPVRPYVNYWFASSEGSNVESFTETISEANQDRLDTEHGACIMYTHLASGFFSDGRLHPRFRSLMERLSRKNGWFVPVTTLLDHLMKAKGFHEITSWERRELELRWLLHKLRVGKT